MLKTIATFSTEIEAELIKGKLESFDIESFIFKDDCGGMRPHMQLTDGVQLKVSDTDFETAKDLLAVERQEAQQVQSDEPDRAIRIRHLLHRARGWILIGFAIIPGWIAFPISFLYSIIASKRYNESGIKDEGLKNQIFRIQIASAFFTILFWAAAMYYICI